MRRVQTRPDQTLLAAESVRADPLAVRSESIAPPSDPVPFMKEHWVAIDIEQDAKRTVLAFLEEVRLGRTVDVGRASKTVEALAGSIFRNQDALLSLGHLRSKDDYTFEHSIGVAVLVITLAKGLRLPREQIHEVGLAGLLHDLGKALTPDGILNKPSRLSPEEYETVKRHVSDSERLLEATPGISRAVVRAAGEHHERFDGSGYPRGLKGERISRYGQMLGICDLYDAVTTDRCYHQGDEPTAVLRHLLETAGRQFEKHLVHGFIRCIGIYPVGTLVRMKSGRLAVVLESGRAKLHKPLVRAFYDIEAREFIDPVDVDISLPDENDNVVSFEKPRRWGVTPHLFLEL